MIAHLPACLSIDGKEIFKTILWVICWIPSLTLSLQQITSTWLFNMDDLVTYIYIYIYTYIYSHILSQYSSRNYLQHRPTNWVTYITYTHSCTYTHTHTQTHTSVHTHTHTQITMAANCYLVIPYSLDAKILFSYLTATIIVTVWHCHTK